MEEPKRGLQRLSTLGYVLLLGTCCGTLLADRVELKTGEVFFGEILRANRREVSMRLESGGIISFRMSHVGYFRKNFVESDEWRPVLVTEPEIHVRDPDDATSFQASPPTETPDDAVVDPVDEVDTTLLSEPVTVPHGFRLSPPRVFLEWESPRSTKRYFDPVTQALLDIKDLGRQSGTISEVKTKLARAHASDENIGREVIQDKEIEDAPFEGWYFEFREANGASVTHQIWLLAKGESGFVVLKYSTPVQHLKDFRQSFAASIQSFSLTERRDDAGGSQPQEPTPAPRVDRAAELLKLLQGQR